MELATECTSGCGKPHKSVDGGTTVSYTYNALGQRVEKKVGSAYSEYAFGAYGELLTVHDRTLRRPYFVPFGGRTLAIYNGGTHFVHVNVLGSTTMTTDYTGAPGQKTLYYPWGQTWVSAGTIKDDRFASLGQRDAETTTWQDPLDPTPFRLYTSGLGRWLSPDPLAGSVFNPQSLNRYAYVLNNPTNLIDPLGLQNPCQEEGVVGVGCPSIDPDFLPPGGCATIIADGSPVGNTCDKPGFTADSSSFGGGGGGGKPGSTQPTIGPAPDPNQPIIKAAPPPPPPDRRPTCFSVFLSELSGDAPSPTPEVVEQGAKAASQAAAARALNVQMERLLVVPLRSSTVRFFVNLSADLAALAEIAPLAFAATDVFLADVKTANARFNGTCRGPTGFTAYSGFTY